MSLHLPNECRLARTLEVALFKRTSSISRQNTSCDIRCRNKKELAHEGNKGLQHAVDLLKPFKEKYPNLSYAGTSLSCILPVTSASKKGNLRLRFEGLYRFCQHCMQLVLCLQTFSSWQVCWPWRLLGAQPSRSRQVLYDVYLHVTCMCMHAFSQQP